MNTHFPDDVVLQILSKLPVKSLLRFKSVSKQWFTLLSNSGFKLSIQRKRALLLKTVKTRTRSRYQFKLLDDDFSLQDLPHPSIRDQPVPKRRKKDPEYTSIRGSCNGLILISIGNSLYLWNPSTRSNLCEVLNSEFLTQKEYHVVASGLCYDSSTDNYKVLLAVDYTYVQDYDSFVIVGSCKSKCWKRIEFPNHIRSVYDGPSLNGYLHWRVRNIDYALNHVVYFDPVTEIFKKFPIPDEDEYGIQDLGELDGYLCIARQREVEVNHDEKFEIWVMKKYGEMGSWSKLFSMREGDVTFLKTLFRAKNGEILMVRAASKLVSYNAEEKSRRVIPTKRGRLNDYETFVESLVSPEAYC